MNETKEEFPVIGGPWDGRSLPFTGSRFCEVPVQREDGAWAVHLYKLNIYAKGEFRKWVWDYVPAAPR